MAAQPAATQACNAGGQQHAAAQYNTLQHHPVRQQCGKETKSGGARSQRGLEPVEQICPLQVNCDDDGVLWGCVQIRSASAVFEPPAKHRLPQIMVSKLAGGERLPEARARDNDCSGRSATPWQASCELNRRGREGSQRAAAPAAAGRVDRAGKRAEDSLDGPGQSDPRHRYRHVERERRRDDHIERRLLELRVVELVLQHPCESDELRNLDERAPRFGIKHGESVATAEEEVGESEDVPTHRAWFAP